MKGLLIVDEVAIDDLPPTKECHGSSDVAHPVRPMNRIAGTNINVSINVILSFCQTHSEYGNRVA